MDIMIRRARPEDIPQMCGLLADLFAVEADFTPDTVKQARGLSTLVAGPSDSSCVAVAIKGGDVVGMASVQTVISTAEGGPVGLVEDVVVRRDCRGAGIGTRLLSEILEWCGKKKMSRLQLLADVNNGQALNFYRGRGWEMTGLVCVRKHI